MVALSITLFFKIFYLTGPFFYLKPHETNKIMNNVIRNADNCIMSEYVCVSQLTAGVIFLQYFFRFCYICYIVHCSCSCHVFITLTIHVYLNSHLSYMKMKTFHLLNNKMLDFVGSFFLFLVFYKISLILLVKVIRTMFL